eukprot:12150856-Alexandrium_andersonii.AAC.1
MGGNLRNQEFNGCSMRAGLSFRAGPVLELHHGAGAIGLISGSLGQPTQSELGSFGEQEPNLT